GWRGAEEQQSGVGGMIIRPTQNLGERAHVAIFVLCKLSTQIGRHALQGSGKLLWRLDLLDDGSRPQTLVAVLRSLQRTRLCLVLGRYSFHPAGSGADSLWHMADRASDETGASRAPCGPKPVAACRLCANLRSSSHEERVHDGCNRCSCGLRPLLWGGCASDRDRRTAYGRNCRRISGTS